jgi:hypothetical protein
MATSQQSEVMSGAPIVDTPHSQRTIQVLRALAIADLIVMGILVVQAIAYAPSQFLSDLSDAITVVHPSQLDISNENGGVLSVFFVLSVLAALAAVIVADLGFVGRRAWAARIYPVAILCIWLLGPLAHTYSVDSAGDEMLYSIDEYISGALLTFSFLPRLRQDWMRASPNRDRSAPTTSQVS